MDINLVRAANSTDLRTFSDSLKAVAAPDDPLDGYTRTKGDADKMRKCEMPEAVMTAVLNAAPAAVLAYKGRAFSIVLTADAWHNHKWHLSITEIRPDGMVKLDDDMAGELMAGFFDDWREVPNPGKLEEIRHYAGS